MSSSIFTNLLKDKCGVRIHKILSLERNVPQESFDENPGTSPIFQVKRVYIET